MNVHRTVERQTERYLRELKRYNYTTPTSYLELIRYASCSSPLHAPQHLSIQHEPLRLYLYL